MNRIRRSVCSFKVPKFSKHKGVLDEDFLVVNMININRLAVSGVEEPQKDSNNYYK